MADRLANRYGGRPSQWLGVENPILAQAVDVRCLELAMYLVEKAEPFPVVVI